MPRTQINFPKTAPPADRPETGGTRIGDAVLHVTWSPADKGAHVQVALEVEQGYAQLALAHPNGDAPDTTYLFSPALSRDELNKLIKTLREARDKAYGRDE